MHHAWLLTGPRGIGKASFAQAAATRLLAEAAGPPIAAPGLDTPDNHPTARLIAAGSHPDYRFLERVENKTVKTKIIHSGIIRVNRRWVTEAVTSVYKSIRQGVRGSSASSPASKARES